MEVTPAGDEAGSFTAKLRDIAVRSDWQVRERLNRKTVWDYFTAYASGANFPPVQVANINGALVLVDGWHRIEALKQLGREEVDALVVAETVEDGRWKAAVANLAHGLPLKRAERRNVFRVYIKTGQHRKGRKVKTYREIQKDLGGLVSKSTVENWMKDDFPKIAAIMASSRDFNKGGTPYSRGGDEPSHMASKHLREALKLAAAEAKGIACPVGRLALALELELLAKDIAQAKPFTGRDIADDNDDL